MNDFTIWTAKYRALILRRLEDEAAQLRRQYKALTPGSREWAQLHNRIVQLEKRIQSVKGDGS